MPYQVDHFINGKQVHEDDNTAHDLINPATGEVQGHVYYASLHTIDEAVSRASAAFPGWSETTLSKRAQILFRFKALLDKHTDRLAQLLTQEHGKTLTDARGSIQRGIAVVDYACGIGDHLMGGFAPEVSRGIDAYSFRQPLGVCVGITPFNFPVMIPLWMFPLAIACGNTFILKPSEKDPSAALLLAELLQEAGLPNGVFNVVQGDQTAVKALVEHPDVAAISFVGSSQAAESVYRSGIAAHKRVQAFGGAKNHCVVMPDASLDEAADAIMGAAYGSAGERCMAISVVVAVGDKVADALVDALQTKIPALTIGEGTEDVSMGPLVTEEHLHKVIAYIESGVNEGAKLVVDGRKQMRSSGNFLGASLFDHATTSMKIYQEEIFGPVLTIIRAKDFAEAIELVSHNQYGNGAAIFTTNPQIARVFVHQVHAGMVGVNIPIPVPIAQFSFGGWKRSMFGDIHMHGPEAIQFYTKLKTVTQKWPGVEKLGPEYTMPTIG